LASHQGNVRRMVGAGVVPTLVAIANKSGIDTQFHCLIALTLISYEPSVRVIIAQEGAVEGLLMLSHNIGTAAAVHYCGLAISNIAAEEDAQQILVQAGAIATLMKWMDNQTHGGGNKSIDEDKLIRQARQRAHVPPVEDSELLPLEERFSEPKVKFEQRSLPWRKFRIQMKVVEPEPPSMPGIRRPEASKSRGKTEDQDSMTEDAKAMMQNVMVDIKSHVAREIKFPDETVLQSLKAKDKGSWAKRNEVGINHFKASDIVPGNENKPVEASRVQDEVPTQEGTLENLFSQLRVERKVEGGAKMPYNQRSRRGSRKLRKLTGRGKKAKKGRRGSATRESKFSSQLAGMSNSFSFEPKHPETNSPTLERRASATFTDHLDDILATDKFKEDTNVSKKKRQTNKKK